MYSYNELNAVELSATKKDYYQVWNELLEVAGKLSARWDPAATNESDPGIVLLKVLTAVADKLAYNIDVNSLEAFMPSAAQEESMRKLCNMLGYNMRYFESAATKVRITYHGKTFPTGNNIRIDRYTNLKDVDGAVNYITLDDVILTPNNSSVEVECLEGELVEYKSATGKTVTLSQLDDNHRFYLPELQVATNGVFITSAAASSTNEWERVDNLNTEPLNTKVYKFGYDSIKGLPFLQFPEDIGTLIGDGLYVKYVRTKGVQGNIAVGTLHSMETPVSWASAKTTTTDQETTVPQAVADTQETEDWSDISKYTVYNISAAVGGKDPETIDEAYWNYQKTIGTFDTLVTCRDYMNKVYQLTESDVNSTPLVSNIIVSDIRDDLNHSYSLCTMTREGLEYKSIATKTIDENTGLETEDMSYFDLIFYPFNTIETSLDNTEEDAKKDYISSFLSISRDSYLFSEGSSTSTSFAKRLNKQKTIAHEIKKPLREDDIACVKVYFKLSAKINTLAKVTAIEAEDIKSVLYKALYKNFNMRNMTFGEELPYDSILKVLETSDPRVKNVSLDDPKMVLTISLVSGEELPINSDSYVFADRATATKAKDKYLWLVIKNILAGRLQLLNYDDTYSLSYNNKEYPAGSGALGFARSFLQEDEKLMTFDDGEASYPVSSFSYTNGSHSTTGSTNDEAAKTLVYISTTPTKLTIGLSNDGAAGSWAEFCSGVNDFQIDFYKPGGKAAAFSLFFKKEEKSKLVGRLYSGTIEPNNQVKSTWWDSTASFLTSELDKNEINVTDFSSLVEVALCATDNYIDKVVIITDTDNLTDSYRFKFEVSQDDPSQSPVTSITMPTLVAAGSNNYVTFNDAENKSLKEVKESDNSPLPTIAKVEGEVKINTALIEDGSPLVLNKNEVIQFRAPNFKTITTYPAYVNYYVHIDTSNTATNSRSVSGSFAATPTTMISVLDYFGSVDGWAEKINSFPEQAKPGNSPKRSWLITPLYTTTANSGLAQGPDVWGGTGAESENEKADNQALKRIQQERGAAFIYEGGTFTLFAPTKDTPIKAGIDLYGLNITSDSFANLFNWIKSENPNIKSLYSRTVESASRQPGKLVDSAGRKYKELLNAVPTACENTLDAMNKIFLPETHADTVEAQHTADGLGADAVYAGIPANTEFTLPQGSFILLNYSTSEGQEDGKTIQKNIYIGPGTQVKTNITLADSAQQSATVKFNKTDVSSTWLDSNGYVYTKNIEGMYTLGPNDTLEVRERIEVTLDNSDAYLYWTTKDEKLTFPATPGKPYILQDGEYLYFTNSAKESMAYYGAGSEISVGESFPTWITKSTAKMSTKQANTLGLVKALPWTAFDLAADKAAITIREYQYINLAPGDQLKSIRFTDDANQVLDNTFKNVEAASYIISGKEGELAALEVPNSGWQVRSKMEVEMGPQLPQILTVQTTPTGEEMARDFIYLKDPDDNITQVFTPLADGDSLSKEALPDLSVYADSLLISASGAVSLVKPEDETTDGAQENTTDKEYIDIQFKTCAYEKVLLYNNSVFSLSNTVAGFSQLPIDPIASQLKDQDKEDESVKFIEFVTLNSMVPSDNSEPRFNLIPIYYQPVTSTASSTEQPEQLSIYLTTSDSATGLKIFNHDQSWWQAEAADNINGFGKIDNSYGEETRYYLRDGLNIIQVESSQAITIHVPKMCRDELYISSMRTVFGTNVELVDEGNGTTNRLIPKLNSKLAFGFKPETLTPQIISDDTDAIVDTVKTQNYTSFKYHSSPKTIAALFIQESEVLSRIKDLDPTHDFLYTVEPGNTEGIEFNIFDVDDDLLFAKNWFDPQNINNKFVVSEIDANYLKDHVTVSKFSIGV